MIYLYSIDYQFIYSNDYNIGGYMRRNRQKRIFAQNNKYERNIFKRFGNWFRNLKTWQKSVWIVLLVILILTLAIAGYVFSKLSMINKVFLEKQDLSCVDVDGYVNILLLGVDSRDMDNIKGTGADAIMVLSLKEETGEVKLMSVYRDTYLKMGNSKQYGKITDANRIGGPKMMIQTLNQAMDLNIHQFVVVNFKMVSDLVNAVDGITVDVEDYEISELNKYTIETAEAIGQKNYNLVEHSGKQTLEGVQAVSYGRIRKGVGDDFKRTERMRTVLTKVFKKMQNMDVKQLDKLLNKLLPQVQTNISTKDMLIMASQLPTYKISGSESWPYEKTTGSFGGVSYVFPDDLATNTSMMHKKMFGQKNYKPSNKVLNMNNIIIDAVNSSGETTEFVDEAEKLDEEKQEEGDKTENKVEDNGEDENSKPPEPIPPTPDSPTPPGPPTPDESTPTPPTPDEPAPTPPTPGNSVKD